MLITSKLITAQDVRAEARRIGVSLNRLSREAGMSLATIHLWTAGKSSPSLTTVQAYLDALNRLEKKYGTPTQQKEQSR